MNVGRLSPDRCTADTVTSSARSGDGWITHERAHGRNGRGRAEPVGNRRFRVEGQTQSLRVRTSLANMVVGDRGAGNTRAAGRVGECEIGAGSAGFATGFGLGASTRSAAEAQSIGRPGYQGNRSDKEKEKARESGKWGWSGWWQ